jgi:hypothetical protein
MTLVASRRRGITSGHGLVADQTVLASAQQGRPASAVWLVQHCSALGLRLHAQAAEAKKLVDEAARCTPDASARLSLELASICNGFERRCLWEWRKGKKDAHAYWWRSHLVWEDQCTFAGFCRAIGCSSSLSNISLINLKCPK